MPRVTDGRRNITHFCVGDQNPFALRLPAVRALHDDSPDDAGAEVGAIALGDVLQALDAVERSAADTRGDAVTGPQHPIRQRTPEDAHLVQSDSDNHRTDSVEMGETAWARSPHRRPRSRSTSHGSSGGNTKVTRTMLLELMSKLAPHRPMLDALGVPWEGARLGPDGSIEYPSDLREVFVWLALGHADGEDLRPEAPAILRWWRSRSGIMLAVEADMDRSTFRVWVETKKSLVRRREWVKANWAADDGPRNEPASSRKVA